MDEHKKSAIDARYKANALILPALGDEECAKLTADKIRSWLKNTAESGPRLRTKRGSAPKHRAAPQGEDAQLEARRKRQATANRVLTILRAALNRGWEEKKIPSDDEWRRVKPYAEVDAARPRYLSFEEVKRLLNGAGSDFRKLAHGALATGARYGTLRKLNVDNFNPDSQSIEVRTSKSGKTLHIDLNTEGVRFFASITAGRNPEEPMFTKSDGTRWGSSHQTRPMKDACKAGRVKLKSGESINILRHTYASHAIMAGTNMLVVAQNMGHKDTRMIEKHYGHLAPSFKKDAIRKGAPRFGIKAESKVTTLRAVH
jgi:integrase